MGKIQFGYEVYTWFIQGTGERCANKLDDKLTGGCRAATARVPPKCFANDMLCTSRLATVHKFGGNMRDCLDPMTTGGIAHMGLIVALNWQYLVNHIHYKDYVGNGVASWPQMAMGKVDLHQIHESLVYTGYRGWFTVEVQDAGQVSPQQHNLKVRRRRNHTPLLRV